MSADPATGHEESTLPADLLHLRKLNLGCGFDLREGYLNVDGQSFHDPDLVADVRSLGMLLSEHYDEIVAQDLLEHLTRSAVEPTLAEWSRLLAPTGRLVLRVPDLVGLLGLFMAHPSVDVHRELEQCLYGTQAYQGDFHQSGFTELTLRHRLASAGHVGLTVASRRVAVRRCRRQGWSRLGTCSSVLGARMDKRAKGRT